ncbi:MAG TPA: serine/threonine-protein kinase [Phycisphaerales bacterium]|nr:serine/threonine-protein kinase [Phycisphaerales bacterium]
MSDPKRHTDLSETSPLARSGPGIDPSASKPGLGSTGPAVPTTEEILQEVAKSGSNVDSIVGRLVIDQGFATVEEVQHCLTQAKSGVAENNSRSLVELLVDNDYITKRQMQRLREQALAERSGQKIPGFKAIKKLGSGAMANVVLAKQISLDRLVAIKVLPLKFTTNKQFVERFYAEGRAAAQLNHPNIVAAYDVGKAGEYYYFVMEYVDGTTVYDQIVTKKRVPEEESVQIALQVAEALQHAHERGLIHRDVKPKNIMLTREGVVKLADMGLARAISDKEAAEAEQGKAFGTPYYISPEQIRGEVNIGPPADIYSLGATLYHMVTGQVPFDGKNPSAVMHKHLKAELVPPDHVYPRLSAGLSEVIEMMMAKDPKKRYQNCKDLITDLRAVKAKQTPPIAHKDFGAADLTALASAEAKAQGEIAAVQPAGGPVVRPWLLGLLVLSGLLNIVQLVISLA